MLFYWVLKLDAYKEVRAKCLRGMLFYWVLKLQVRYYLCSAV